MIPGVPKTDIDSYFDQTKPYIKALIKNQLKEMGSAKIIMTLWVMKIGREEKFVLNLKDKKGYVVHIKVLGQALKHGQKLKKVHRVIEFRQSKWMKAYIMLNTRLRKDAKNEFEKDFFKLMNNSVFGKTMENRNHEDMKLVTSDKKYLKYVMKPNFKDGHPFSKHLFAVEMGKIEITINKPLHFGQAIFDLSK